MIPAMATPAMALQVVALVILPVQGRSFPSERQSPTEDILGRRGATTGMAEAGWTPPYGREKHHGLLLVRGLWKVRSSY